MIYRLKQVVLCVLASVWVPAGLWAQEAVEPGKALTQYVHDVWQADDGLPQSTVMAIAQTRDGYLWLGTQEGLVRFDGLTFTTFDKRNTPAFAASHNIRALFEDGTGALWIGTFGGGLIRYANHQFIQQENVTGTQISALTTDRDGTLWVSTFDAGLFALRAGSATHYTLEDGLPDLFVGTLRAAPEGGVWAGTKAGLYHVHGRKTTPLADEAGWPSDYIEEVFIDQEGVGWISTHTGVARFNEGRVLGADAEPLLDAVAFTFLEDRQGYLWMGTDSGLVRYRAGQVDVLTQEDGLSHNRVLALLEDQEGSLWIGTDGGGLNRLRDDKFTTYTEQEGLVSNMAFAVYEDTEGALWIGSENAGLTRMKDGTLSHITTADGLSDNAVYSLAGDGAGTLWIGTYGGGLNRWKHGTITTLSTADGLVHDAISALYDDGAGTLWIGTDGGLSRFRNERFTNYTPADGLASPYVLALNQDRQGALWIGTYGGGLQRLHNGAFTAHYTTETEQPGARLGSDVVVALHEEADGTLWIGTFGGGLSRLRSDTLATLTVQHGLLSDTIYRILEDDDGFLWMSSNLGVFRVHKDDLHAVADGHRAAVTPAVYGKPEGLKSQEMNGGFQPAGWKDRAGRLWFPSIQGVAMVDPARLDLNLVHPPVVIEEIVVDKEHFSPVEQLDLAPGKNKIEFHFAALSFIDPARVIYKYRLEGYDDEWSELSAERMATYTNLDPGTYTFQVVARNRDGVWSTTAATFSITLRPFFYQTFGFWLVVAMAVGLLVFGLHRMRINHLKARQQELEQTVRARTEDLCRAKDRIEAQAHELRVLNENLEAKVQEQFQQMVADRQAYEQQLIDAKERAEASERLKTAILDNVSHEWRTPLATILGYTQILHDEVDEHLKEFVVYIDQSGHRLMHMLTSILDLSNLEAHMLKVKRQRVNVVDVAHQAIAGHQAQAQDKGVQLHLKAEHPDLLALADQGALARVLDQLVGNAIKFTDSGDVVVQVEKGEDDVQIHVADTGIGISQAFLGQLFEAFKQESEGLERHYEGNGLGLTIAHHLVQLMEGTIHVESTKGEGSTFTVTLHPAPASDEEPTPGSSTAVASFPPPLHLPAPPAKRKRSPETAS